MNIKMKSIAVVLTMAAAVMAQEPAPAAAPAAAEPAPAATEPAPAAAPAETAAPTAEAATPAAEAAAPAEEAAAPVAVRDGAAPTPAPESAPVAAPAPTETKTTKVIYQPVYEDPNANRSEPVHVVYVTQKPGKDSVSFDELRGLVPMKLSFGIQGFIGSYIISGDYDDSYYRDEIEDYSGMAWRAGGFVVVPLNEYTVGLKIGVAYDQSIAKNSGYVCRDYSDCVNAKVRFSQSKIDIPLLFSFKGPRSSFSFDIGTELDVPIKDEFRVDLEGSGVSKLDMIDKENREMLDWNIVFGFALKANQYVGMDFRFNMGLSDMYDVSQNSNLKMFKLDDLSSASFMIGLSIYPF